MLIFREEKVDLGWFKASGTGMGWGWNLRLANTHWIKEKNKRKSVQEYF